MDNLRVCPSARAAVGPPEALKKACRRHIRTRFPGAVLCLLPHLDPQQQSSAGLFFVLCWLLAAHDALRQYSRACRVEVVESVEVEGRVPAPPWRWDTWGLPEHVQAACDRERRAPDQLDMR